MRKRKLELDKELLTENEPEVNIDAGAPTWSCGCTWDFCTWFWSHCCPPEEEY